MGGKRMIFEHLLFQELTPNPKTKRFMVVSRFDDSDLGIIEWYGRWRCYCFTPIEGRVWSWECLKELSEFIKFQMDLRKRK
jgi:hypothetical protein